jgi:deoxyuridine 5'-triphosphate nucleotidohydrolase
MRYITKTDLLIVAKNSGYIMIGIGIMCLIPLIFDLVYFEFDLISFIIPSAISILLGYGLLKYFEEKAKKTIRLKHGMMISSFAWLWASIIGGLVFMLATHMPPVDAIFESMSALTGTGITMFENVEILPHETKLIGTGISCAVPEGYFGGVFARSGLSSKEGLRPANCVGVVDSDYRGEIKVALHNDSETPRTIVPNQKIAQFVVVPFLTVEFQEVAELDSTDRGEGGFGSTGKV